MRKNAVKIFPALIDHRCKTDDLRSCAYDRVVEYQKRVSQFQRDLSENAQAIDAAYQEALSTIQKKHLDPIIEGVIAKKHLDLVIDGRMARVCKEIKGLDITDEVVKALNKKISSVKMDTPKGL